VFIICGRKQSPLQIVALVLLACAGIIVNLEGVGRGMLGVSFQLGVVPVLIASLLSGFSAAVTERVLRQQSRNSFLYTLELSIYSVIVLLLSFVGGPDQAMIQSKGFFHGWTLWTMAPVLTQASGGLIIGFVAKYAGSEMKGFALIVGIILTAALQTLFYPESQLVTAHYIALSLVVVGMYLHTKFPPKPVITKTKSE
jgi:UDP-sugar transporter A1/2/3